jgi:DNA-binding MarR family transcriptional regulator
LVAKPPSQPPRITDLLKQLEVALRAQVDPLTRKFAVTGPQYTLLTTIRRFPGISSAELARRSHVSAQAANQVVAALEAKGLVERRENEVNRRILDLHLSKAGKSVLASCDKELDRVEQQLVGELAASRLVTVRKALETWLAKLEAAES